MRAEGFFSRRVGCTGSSEAMACATVRNERSVPRAARWNKGSVIPELAESLLRTRAHGVSRDVSPDQIRMGMDFERARAFEREGDTMRARVYLEDALDAFPEYAHAATHAALVESPDRRARNPRAGRAALERSGRHRRTRRRASTRAARRRRGALRRASGRARFEENPRKASRGVRQSRSAIFSRRRWRRFWKRALDLAKSAAAESADRGDAGLWLTAARASSSANQEGASRRLPPPTKPRARSVEAARNSTPRAPSAALTFTKDRVYKAGMNSPLCRPVSTVPEDLP